jgi:hypothetical protein
MVDRIADSANNAAVLATNNSELSEVTCSCVKLKIELEKTLTELKSTQKVVELLQEEIKLNTYHLTGETDANYLQRNEDSTQLEGNGRWSVIRPKRQKMNRNPQQFKIRLLVNHFVMPTGEVSGCYRNREQDDYNNQSCKTKI